MEHLISAIAEPWITVFTLSLTRVTAFIVTFPLFRAASIPRLVKVSWAFALAIAVIARSETITPIQFGVSPWLDCGLSVARESIVGAILGFGMGLWLAPAQIAGAYIAQEMGLSIATQTNPSSGEMSNVIAELFLSLAIIVFFVSDAHLVVIRAVLKSFDRFPVGGGLAFEKFYFISKGVSESQVVGMQIAAPVGALLLLMTLGLGTMMKAIPQFNLFTFGTTLRVVCGLVSIFVLMPELIAMIERVFRHMHAVISNFGM